MSILMIPVWLQAGFWGLVSGSALLVGAAVGYLAKVPKRTVASIMAFGSGVLISALAFDLMEEAYHRAGFVPAAIGFICGAAIYTVANVILARNGARHRKRSGHQQPSEEQATGSGMAIAIGSLIDGIPESIVIGVSMIEGGSVSLTAVIAIFLSNVPEGLSSSTGMKKAGRSARFIFTLWLVIMLVSGAASLAGYSIFSHFSDEVIAATIGVAAGAILTMLTDTMIPEAVEEAHDLVGLITVCGFLAAYMLSKLET